MLRFRISKADGEIWAKVIEEYKMFTPPVNILHYIGDVASAGAQKHFTFSIFLVMSQNMSCPLIFFGSFLYFFRTLRRTSWLAVGHGVALYRDGRGVGGVLKYCVSNEPWALMRMSLRMGKHMR